jgi:hypothetical protein
MGQKGVIDDGAARVLTGGDGSVAFCELGCRRVAGNEELLQIGVVLLVPLARVGRLCVGGSTGGRAAAELGAHRHCGEQHSGARK